jgi:hypothetical protein
MVEVLIGSRTYIALGKGNGSEYDLAFFERLTI